MGDQTTVLVGPNEAKFMLPKALLTDRGGDFFKKALNGSFAEATSSILPLPEDDPGAFKLFIEYLFTRRLPAICVHDQHKHNSFEQMQSTGMVDHETRWHTLCHLSNKYLLSDLKCLALKRITEYHDLTMTVCHPILIEKDYEALNENDDDMVEFVWDQLKAVRHTHMDEYSLFVAHLTTKTPLLFTAVMMRSQHEFVTTHHMLEEHSRNGLTGSSTMDPAMLLPLCCERDMCREADRHARRGLSRGSRHFAPQRLQSDNMPFPELRATDASMPPMNRH